MKIVPVEEIPKTEEIEDAPTDKDDLIAVYKVCKEMEKVCLERKGIGLNAVQVGIPWKLFIVNSDNGFEYFLNCSYDAAGDDKVVSLEGCLSLLNDEGDFRRFEVMRHMIVKVVGQKLVTKKNNLTLEDFSAYIHAEENGVVFQHEIDHHLGLLISDIGKEVLIW